MAETAKQFTKDFFRQIDAREKVDEEEEERRWRIQRTAELEEKIRQKNAQIESLEEEIEALTEYARDLKDPSRKVLNPRVYIIVQATIDFAVIGFAIFGFVRFCQWLLSLQ